MSHPCLIHSYFISINPHESWAGTSAREGYKQDLFCKRKAHAKRKKVLIRHLNLIQMEVKWISLQKDYDISTALCQCNSLACEPGSLVRFVVNKYTIYH